MTARTVSSTLCSPASATLRGGVGVTIELWSAGRSVAGITGDRRRLLGRTWAEADATGVWTAQLEPNAGTGVVLPETTVYRVTERLADATEWTYYILVPDDPGPHQATDLAVDSDGQPLNPAATVVRYQDGTAMRYSDGTPMEYA